MKNVLITGAVHAVLERERSFLDRSDLRVFVASTAHDALAVHHAERLDLIVASTDLPGMAAGQFCDRLRERPGRGSPPLILVCPNTPESIASSSRCGADAVLPEPVHPVLLVAKAQQLLFIPARESLRVTLQTEVSGRAGGTPFSGRTRNISETGLLIETSKLLAEAARLSCQFYLPVARQVRAAGRIVRIIERSSGSGSYHYGLMFTDIAPEDRKLIADYVAAVSREDEGGAAHS